MNILLLSRAYEPTKQFVSEFLDSKNLQIGYLAGRTELEKKNFARTKSFYEDLGEHELEYFDIDQEFSDETFKKLKQCHAIHFAEGSSSYLQWRMMQSGFTSFMKEFLYIGGKVTACGASSIALSNSIAIGREFSDPLPEIYAKGLGLIPFEVFPYYSKEQGLDLRLKTLSSQSGGRVILAIPDDSAISLDKDQILVQQGVNGFYQYIDYRYDEAVLLPLDSLKSRLKLAQNLEEISAADSEPNAVPIYEPQNLEIADSEIELD